MSACQRCGFCCTYAQMRLDNTVKGRDQARWFQLHGCRVIERDGYIKAFIPITCSALVFDMTTKKYSCAIYNERPQICCDYECNNNGGMK